MITATFPCQHCQKELTFTGEPILCECGHGQMAVIVSVDMSPSVEQEEQDAEGQEIPEGDAQDAGRQDDV